MPPKKKEVNLDELFKSGAIRKGNDDYFKYTRIPFDIEPLDKLTGGGLPTKRLTLIMGDSNTGKSLLAFKAVKSIQEKGGTAAWIDAEWSWDDEWAKENGVNTEEVLVSQPESGEVAFDIIRELMRAKIDLVVLDSVAALVPTALNEENLSHSPMANRARMVNDGISRLMSNLGGGTTLLFINQLREGIGPYAQDVTPGGMAQTFFAHIILQVRREGWVEETVDGEKTRVGFNINIRQRKSKVKGASYDDVTISFRLHGGIDLVELLIDDLVDKKLITKGGAWYMLKDGTKAQGRNGLKEYFIKNPDVLEMLKKEMGNVKSSE